MNNSPFQIPFSSACILLNSLSIHLSNSCSSERIQWATPCLYSRLGEGKGDMSPLFIPILPYWETTYFGFLWTCLPAFFTMRYQIWSCLWEDICDNECNIGDIFSLITPADRINYINAFGIHVDGDGLTLWRPPHCSFCIPEELRRWPVEDSLLRTTYFRSWSYLLPPDHTLLPSARALALPRDLLSILQVKGSPGSTSWRWKLSAHLQQRNKKPHVPSLQPSQVILGVPSSGTHHEEHV